jgi:hypothetical protein
MSPLNAEAAPLHEPTTIKRERATMTHLIQPSLMAAAVLGLIGGMARRAEASIDLTTPAGLTPGEQFRFVFVTDGTTTASDPSIAVYDGFVTSQAGFATYYGTIVDWLAIGTTATVNAIDHIGTDPITGVFLADGTIVTTSTDTLGLWSGSLLHAINEDINSTVTPLSTVWTGTFTDGTNSTTTTLGGTRNVTAGSNRETSGAWTNLLTFPNGDQRPMYAISQVLTVPRAPSGVPEPSTAIVAAVGAVAFIANGWSRRRAQRRQAAA